MLTIHGAAERMSEEFAVLLDSAGFRLERIVEVDGAMKLIEAAPVWDDPAELPGRACHSLDLVRGAGRCATR
ncbi:MAG: hypothetical protein QOJ59_3441 [Thermomicrobiales bacterium]|nr:hypothetical protein [Thermomicrobiales bacterium]MEA2526695.1 hypothetical protein [Thermomicrobiales bacterium]